MTGGADEWLTIAEAAARLGVVERHARRCVQLLPAEERSAPGVRPAKVRWTPQNAFLMSGKVSDLNVSTDSMSGEMSEMEGDRAPIGPDQPPAGSSTPPEMSETSPAHLSETVRTESEVSGHAPDDRESLLEQLRSENAFLRAELTETRQAAEVAGNELRRLLLIAIPPPAIAPKPEPAIGEGAEPPKLRTGWVGRMLERIRGRRDD